jgi:hypothetical protein
MGFFSRLGSKISHGLEAGARLGKKVLGTVNRVGNKIATQGAKIVSGVERIPIIGQALAPITGVARSGLGLIKNVSDMAGRGVDMIEDAEDIVRRGGSAIRTGDVQSASEVVRRGANLVGSAKSQLERAKEVKRDAVKIATRDKN